MEMTQKERNEWLTQINRIHEEEKLQRNLDSESEIERILKICEKNEDI